MWIGKIDKPFTKITERKSQINKIGDEKDPITTDSHKDPAVGSNQIISWKWEPKSTLSSPQLLLTSVLITVTEEELIGKLSSESGSLLTYPSLMTVWVPTWQLSKDHVSTGHRVEGDCMYKLSFHIGQGMKDSVSSSDVPYALWHKMMDVLAPGKGMCLENLISQKPALACQQDAKSLAFINKGRTGCPSSPGSLGWVKGCTDLGSATGLFPESPDLWCLCYLSSPEPQRPAHPLCSGLHRDVMWRPHFCLYRSNPQASSTGF